MATPIPGNQCSFTRAEICDAAGAQLAHGECERVRGISIDSRTISAGMLFVALRGVRDGHDFIGTAANGGAAAALIERGRSSSALPCFEVEDTLAALGCLARAHLERLRRVHAFPTIAIGGAAGKTTTKQLVAALMRTLYGEIVATPGNLNNLIGVPMTAFTVEERHGAVVLECGTNQKGEVAQLSAIVQPDVALVLNVDYEHIAGLGSLEGVADEEAALFADARRSVLSTEETALIARAPERKERVTFGVDASADVRLKSREMLADGRQRIELEVAPRLLEAGAPSTLRASLKLLGGAAALNAAAGFAAALASLERPARRDELDAMAGALAEVNAVEGRMRLVERGGITVIDDSYNSNPRSLRAALETAREIAQSRPARLVVAIGDMLELGDLSSEMHVRALDDIAAAAPDECLLTGEEFNRAARAPAAARKLPSRTVLAQDSDEAARQIGALIEPGDVLLVKGSRGVAMERVIAALGKDS